MEEATEKVTPLDKQADELASIPSTVSVSINGVAREVEIYKCKVKQLGPVLRLVSTVLKELGFNDVSDKGMQDEMITRTNDPNFLLQLIANSTDKVLSVASQLCSLSEDEMGELDLDDAAIIVIKIWEINESFFSQRVLPLLNVGK